MPFTLKDKHDDIWFEYHESPPPRTVDWKDPVAPHDIYKVNLAALHLYGLYRTTVYDAYRVNTDLAEDIKAFKSVYKDPNHDPVYHYSVHAIIDAMKEWMDSNRKMQAYIAYKFIKGIKTPVGFVHFVDDKVDKRPVTYIAQAGAKMRGKSIARRLIECVLSHYPENTEFYILARNFNTEAILNQTRFEFDPIKRNEIEQLGYDERYCGFKSKSTKKLITEIESRKIPYLVDVNELSRYRCPTTIKTKSRFATDKNFTGRKLKGYEAKQIDFSLMAPQAAVQLCQAQNAFLKFSCGLKIYDSYRPKTAVEDIYNWANKNGSPTVGEFERWSKHNPLTRKSRFFELNFAAEDSSHCRGHAVDVEVVNIKTGRTLFMGARISYMGRLSHPDLSVEEILKEWSLLKEAKQFDDVKKQWKKSSGTEWQDNLESVYAKRAIFNRNFLQEIMCGIGFQPHPFEWWHFEGTPDYQESMDLTITDSLKGIASI